jgi:hypothetical protein
MITPIYDIHTDAIRRFGTRLSWRSCPSSYHSLISYADPKGRLRLEARLAIIGPGLFPGCAYRNSCREGVPCMNRRRIRSQHVSRV